MVFLLIVFYKMLIFDVLKIFCEIRKSKTERLKQKKNGIFYTKFYYNKLFPWVAPGPLKSYNIHKLFRGHTKEENNLFFLEKVLLLFFYGITFILFIFLYFYILSFVNMHRYAMPVSPPGSTRYMRLRLSLPGAEPARK